MICVSDIYYDMKIDRFAKDLATGSYDLLVLNELQKRPTYGYEIVRHIATRSKHTTRWHFGTVYHVLHHLERQGLVASRWQRAGRHRERKYYRLTARGRAVWHRQRAQWQVFSKTVNALLGL
jgi:PadR family transcriptional regulator, regulatory protein PadR